ncbi:hypothetical protein CEE36_04725 [candidate division TA06 bacterium B3_TA06]|uniref:Uncharacterized protein n=1 Tax=candidate division TA06 bacterium B3_TA06 TaxID=2012487 RepID=A0A532V828_UNCT6|nr:MAG: hypothetical protein CEE36_04725 [candidate division TA06 bacterium B3_TA06]
MEDYKTKPFVPYKMLTPGFEAVWTGKRLEQGVKLKKAGESKDEAGAVLQEGELADEEGNIYYKWSLWSFTLDEETWDERIRYINQMQEKLGPLSDDVRRIRAQIAGLVHCDSGFPVTADQILDAIGRGKLPDPAFHSGCWHPMGTKTTQPRQPEAMQVIEETLLRYLDGKPAEELISKYPFARGFIKRTYGWFGPLERFTDLQKLMVKRLLLPFEFLTTRNTPDSVREKVHSRCYEPGSEGFKLDDEISKSTGLPDIHVDYGDYQKNMESLTDPAKKKLYRIAYTMRWGLPELSDCHHATFRKMERWLYGIGTGEPEIPTRIKGTERKRLRQLIFGYALALDKWLLGIPMQFLLLDLGHIDLGFDLKNEILRVYAHLGEERTPVKEWLAACLWHNFCYNTTGGWEFGILNKRHRKFYEETTAKGVSVHQWMDSVLAKASSR